MKRGSKGITAMKKYNNPILQVLYEFWFLFTRWQYVVPYLINISGSVLFYYSLASMEMSLVVPVVNSLTFIFTQIVSMLLGEETGTSRTFFGIGSVILGVSICVWSGLK